MWLSLPYWAIIVLLSVSQNDCQCWSITNLSREYYLIILEYEFVVLLKVFECTQNLLDVHPTWLEAPSVLGNDQSVLTYLYNLTNSLRYKEYMEGSAELFVYNSYWHAVDMQTCYWVRRLLSISLVTLLVHFGTCLFCFGYITCSFRYLFVLFWLHYLFILVPVCSVLVTLLVHFGTCLFYCLLEDYI